MARLTYKTPEADIYESMNASVQNKLGNVYNGVDSTVSILTESISSEIINLRRENESLFQANQLSNASGEDLSQVAFEMYGINRFAPSFARVSVESVNLHFYVDSGTFGEINGGIAITIPEGTLVSTEDSFLDNNLIYRIANTYELGADENYVYCAAVALNPGSYANVSSNSLNYHNFVNYSEVLNDGLKVTNKFAIVNGQDEEMDSSLRYRVSNFVQSSVNKNDDAISLKALSVPGIKEVRVLRSYFGIGTLAVVAFGQGRELTKDVSALLEDRLFELRMPGQSVTVVPGITSYLDFKIRVYIKSGISTIEKENSISLIKQNVANLIKEKEFNNFIDFNEISRIIQRSFTNKNILGFGTGENNSSIFEEVFVRKTDRFDLFPEEKEELTGSTYRIGREERIAFGELIIELEEDVRWVFLAKV